MLVIITSFTDFISSPGNIWSLLKNLINRNDLQVSLLPWPSAYVLPFPQEKSLFIFVRTMEWSAPHSTYSTDSFGYNKYNLETKSSRINSEVNLFIWLNTYSSV